MAVPENIGGLYRTLLSTPAVPKTEFDPFDEPPPFEGRREMIGMGKSRRGEADNRIKYRNRQEVIYARTRPEQRHWREADTRMIVAALDRAEEWVTQVIGGERDAFADFMRAQDPNSPPE
jgi:hypothetical protein